MRRLLKTAALSILALVTLAMIVSAAVVWRVSQGPLSLNFMRDRIQREINANLGGMTVRLAGVVLERDSSSGMPHFRLRNVELFDPRGEIIARSPRAAIGFDGQDILTGRFTPKQIELIGPRVVIKRTLGGDFQLGFGNSSTNESEMAAQGQSQGKGDQEGSESTIGGIAPETTGSTLIDFLSGTMPDGANSSIVSLDKVIVSDAAIMLYDEVNSATWYMPKVNLAIRRMNYGFTLFSDAQVASGNQPWRAELSASFRKEDRSFSVSGRIFDLVPADIADEIFALSKLAQVKLPLSGHVELEFDENANIRKGSAEFTASAGEVGFPGFIAEPLSVDEGLLRLDFDPSTGGVIIGDSTLLVSGSQAQLSGRIDPIREPDRRLTALSIAINARNLNLDKQGTVKDAVAIDRVEFKGTASIHEARLDVEDLIVMTGDAGVRVRGSFTGGERSVGIRVAGRIRDLPAPILKKLWPPIISPKTRQWVTENIKSGRVTEGEFTVNLPVNALADGLRDKFIPNEAISARFGLADVQTSYFRDLPLITGASGEGHLKGNEFLLTLDQGKVILPSGREIALKNGRMTMTSLLAPITPAVIQVQGISGVAAVVEYMDLPALNLLSKSGVDLPKISGDATVSLSLDLPLRKDNSEVSAKEVAVKVSAKAAIRNASVKDALNGVDLTDGKLDFTIADGVIKTQGPVKLNGIPAKLSWTREPGPEGEQTAVIETELDDKDREKIGAKVNDFLRGPVKVKVSISGLGGGQRKVMVDADLSKAELHIDAIEWWRPPAPKTSASFVYTGKDGKAGAISDLIIKGDGILLRGDIEIGKDGSLVEANLPIVQLSEINSFGLVIKNGDQARTIAVTGKSFDARALIRSLFGNRSGTGASKDSDTILSVDATIDRVYAHRGEVITSVSGNLVMRYGAVQRGNLTGTFVSGQPITIRIEPSEDGGRLLRIGGRDAGAALRAANLYSKVAGGQIEFSANLGHAGEASVREGRLTLRDFEVRDEAALVELDRKGKPKKKGPRREGVAFSRLTLPFTTDSRFIRIGDTLVKGPELGATAQGLIRKSDGAIDIDGTIIPVYALNAAIGEIPLIGDILTGGKGEGVFGVTYALGGTMAKPRFQVNPVSAIAPGILRKFFEYGNTGGNGQTSSNQGNPLR
ncbi:MAG: DUF3971 domain-containing protein [Parvibaculaceae bacterium]